MNTICALAGLVKCGIHYPCHAMKLGLRYVQYK
jgi:hypothetical protein